MRLAQTEQAAPQPAKTAPPAPRLEQAEQVEQNEQPEPPEPDDLAQLTDDPLLARADRITGLEVRGMVAFTFDDGPNPETTPRVMEALERYDVPATFFVVTRRLVGPLAEANRAVLAQQLAAGFLVASHSVSHTNLETVSTKAIRREIDQSVRVLSEQAALPIGLFRAPFGALDDRGREHLKRRGLTEVKWSIDPMDWRELDGDLLRERALAAILAQEGGVVLMHDVKEVTARSIGRLLDDLEAANCRRLRWKQAPILPASLHYWLRDNGKPRPVPEAVKQRTAAYRKVLPIRCIRRAKR